MNKKIFFNKINSLLQRKLFYNSSSQIIFTLVYMLQNSPAIPHFYLPLTAHTLTYTTHTTHFLPSYALTCCTYSQMILSLGVYLSMKLNLFIVQNAFYKNQSSPSNIYQLFYYLCWPIFCKCMVYLLLKLAEQFA